MKQLRYFGTDGIRGRVGVHPITPDFLLKLGFAVGQVLMCTKLSSQKTCPTVLIGKDTRISGYTLESALESGFSAAGVNVILTGLSMPTSAIAYLTRTLRLSAGVVISASHNHYHDNGIKFFSSSGNKLSNAIEQRIEEALNTSLTFNLPLSYAFSRTKSLTDASNRYIEFCKSMFPSTYNLCAMRLVVDCAHGAAYHIAPRIFHELGAEVISIGDQPNGFNINDGFGTTSPKALITTVIKYNADLGIALDGDADRLHIVDANGRLYDGDQLLYVLVIDRIATHGNIPGAVGTIMTNLGVELALRQKGVKLIRAKVGDRYIFEKLQKYSWILGAEGSGHILSLDKHSTGDGIISALLILAALQRSKKTLAELLEPVHLYPQKLINISINNNFQKNIHPKISRTISKLRKTLGKNGRILLRISGTEPVMRVMVEAYDAEIANNYAQLIANIIQHTLPSSTL